MTPAEAFIAKDLFARHSGIELISVSEGKAKARLVIKEEHMNGMGVVHGGAIFTLADLAFAAACNSYGTLAMAINVSISFLKKAVSGVLTAEAEENSLNPKLGTYTIRVWDESGELVALFQGMAYRKKDKHANG
jgi:acyl-CoA thioesterase